MNWLYIGILYLSVFLDGVRDNNYGQHWLLWHLCKWASMYPLWIYILYKEGLFIPSKIRFQWKSWIALAGAGFLIWWTGAMVELPGR